MAASSSSTDAMAPAWCADNESTDYTIQNLPYGVFSTPGKAPRCGVAIGDNVVDLAALGSAGLLNDVAGLDPKCFAEPTLNAFMGYERPVWQATRARLQQLLTTDESIADFALRDNQALQEQVMVPLSSVSMHLPATIGDYTDFYSSREHATNVGTMFRGKDNALQPNWLHLPVGYHGRASSVYVTGTDVARPSGQLQKDKDDPKQGSVYGACRLLDFELEMAFFVGGRPMKPGEPVTMEDAENHIFGMVVMNDWSARDIQKWEYVPLGPFGAKNFATSISPWVVTLDALEPFRCPTSAGEQSDPVPLEYIRDPSYSSYDIKLEVGIQGSSMDAPSTVTRSNFANLYWNIKQQLVHHSVTGCNMQPGDLLGSGTISGTPQDSFGSMLELCWKGSREVPLEGSDEVRKFLKDGDLVVMTGVCNERPGVPRVGFGAVEGRVLPAGTIGAAPAAVAEASERYANFVLYSYWRSTCSWRVRTALAAKGLLGTTEIRPVNLLQGGHKSDEHAEMNPMKQVPVLEFTDTVTGETIRLTQSMAIMDFLEEAYPMGGALLPRDPVARAQAKEYAEMVNSGTQPLQNPSVFKKIEGLGKEEGVGRQFAKEAIEDGLASLEAKYTSRGANGPFMCGQSPSVADICLVPQLYNGRRFGVDLAAVCPALLAVDEACAESEYFKASHPDGQPDADVAEPPKKKAKA